MYRLTSQKPLGKLRYDWSEFICKIVKISFFFFSEALTRALQITNKNISTVMMSQLYQLQLKCFQLTYGAAAADVIVMLISRTKWRKRRQEQHEGQRQRYER